jgi:type IV pilus assembly protein PilE
MKQKTTGVMLIELLIAVVIIAILAIIAAALYTSQIRAGRRTDAINTLFAISLAEERYRTTNTTYGTLAQVWGGITTSTGGYYTLAISTATATEYTITATATGTQASDSEGGTSCATLTIDNTAGTITQTPNVCFPS